jgi:hypothetical protein
LLLVKELIAFNEKPMIKALTFEQLKAKPSYGWQQTYNPSRGVSDADLKTSWKRIDRLYHHPLRLEQRNWDGQQIGEVCLQYFANWNKGNGNGTFSSLTDQAFHIQFSTLGYCWLGRPIQKLPFCLQDLLCQAQMEGISFYWNNQAVSTYFSHWHHPNEDLKELSKSPFLYH